MRPGVWQLVIIAILVIVIFGGKRLPELGKGLGQGWTNFRQALRQSKSAEKGETLSADDPAATVGQAAESKPSDQDQG